MFGDCPGFHVVSQLKGHFSVDDLVVGRMLIEQFTIRIDGVLNFRDYQYLRLLSSVD
jgi:hypothetical protein